MVVIATGLSRPAARTGEQVLISSFTLQNVENARREIAVGNMPQLAHHIGVIAELWKIDEIPMAMLR